MLHSEKDINQPLILISRICTSTCPCLGSFSTSRLAPCLLNVQFSLSQRLPSLAGHAYITSRMSVMYACQCTRRTPMHWQCVLATNQRSSSMMLWWCGSSWPDAWKAKHWPSFQFTLKIYIYYGGPYIHERVSKFYESGNPGSPKYQDLGTGVTPFGVPIFTWHRLLSRIQL